MTSIQQSYSINPDVGFAGQIAEPNSPMRIEQGILHVPAAGTTPRPGYAVYYDTGNNAWALPTNAATSLRASGILTYRADGVANNSNILEFEDEQQIFVITMGVCWLVAGGATERHQQVHWDRSDFKWNTLARVTAVADMYTNPVEALNNQAVADEALFKAAVGYGRVI